jgi:hypothetical protein
VSGGNLPGTGRISPAPIQPTTGVAEKLGGVVFSCVTAGTANAPTKPATMLPASALPLKVDKGIVVPPLAVWLSNIRRQLHWATGSSGGATFYINFMQLGTSSNCG